MANYDILGNIAILKFHNNVSDEAKMNEAKKILNQYKGVSTVLEKTDKVHGRLRTIKTRLLVGKKTLIANYVENGCKFNLNVETCYFSPRLSNERLEIAKIINKIKKPRVLVMFSGVAPFPIVIAKHSRVSNIVSIELGKDCEKYARENIKLNKLDNIIEHIQGDVKRIIPKLLNGRLSVKGNLVPLQFDVVVMPRPNLKETFLKEALAVSKKGALIIYYGFCAETKLQIMLAEIYGQAEKYKRKVKITNIKEAGDIAPYEHRYRIEMKVL